MQLAHSRPTMHCIRLVYILGEIQVRVVKLLRRFRKGMNFITFLYSVLTVHESIL